MQGNRKRYRRGRKKRKTTKWSLGKKIGVGIATVLVLLLTTGAVYAASMLTKIDIKEEADVEALNISEEVVHEKGYLNVALFGLDARDQSLGEGNRSDSMMIASLNKETGEVKLVSIYRDTLLELSDGSLNKANAAYAFGGPEAAMGLINKNMDMNIEKYVTVNFSILAKLIDAIGGVEIDIMEEEIDDLNYYSLEVYEAAGKGYQEYTAGVGKHLLDGSQAVSYARLRSTAGGDIKRAERQRIVLSAIMEKAKDINLATINKIINDVFPEISTNFTIAEIIKYAKDVMRYSIGETMGFPNNYTFNMLNQVGSVVVPQTLSSNVLEVHQFLFANESYAVSSTVSGIDASILSRSSETAATEVPVDDGGDTSWSAPQESWVPPTTDESIQNPGVGGNDSTGGGGEDGGSGEDTGNGEGVPPVEPDLTGTGG
ncbi:LCP family protein required for cell wall assembly [Lachnospiraceae bacterium PF1-22]|uniref:LCP family protein n=1 Tax=Ohessyouella blattaphilus TaxID=2949333 RepID=UPI00255E223F|nr:LCP family protein [Lachnospiraceae bacterium OttesenSCG-928-J05]